MTPIDITQAALLKVAADKGAWDTAKDFWANGIEPEWKDALIGAGGGALLGGVAGGLSGNGVFSGALGGAALGGVGGYFRKPLWDMASSAFGGKGKTDPEKTDVAKEVKKTPQPEESTDEPPKPEIH